MADELNVPTHRWYQARNHIKLPPNAVSKKWIYANGVALIDAWINSQPWGNPVAKLFAAGEVGVWYDPSDLTTLFQDTAGTTPVTTPGQTVALLLDKSKGLVLGSELVTNGDFSSSAGWTTSNVTIASGVATITGTAPSLSRAMTTVAGRTYQVSITVSGLSGGTLWLRFIFGGSAVSSAAFSNGTARFLLVSNGNTTLAVEQFSGTITAGTIDNISVRELPGFHATQATTASRPTYGIVPRTGRRNLLKYSEDLTNAVWSKSNTTVTANAAVAPDGTTTADKLVENTSTGPHRVSAANFTAAGSVTYTASVYLKAAERVWAIVEGVGGTFAYFNLSNGTIGASGTPSAATITSVGNGWYRCRVTTTPSAGTTTTPIFYSATADGTSNYTGDGTSGIYIWGAQLETGSSATAYQRVGSQFDVTETGVPSLSYLSFDGVDDFLVTPTITPGIDKAQVFAGVRKLSDAATGMLVESSATASSNAGSFFLTAPDSASIRYSSASRGTNTIGLGQLADTSSIAYNAPITNVLAARHDISGDFTALSINGVTVDTATGDQGTGNFLAYPLYIGRRGGTFLPFNGQLYSMIVRFGANLDANTITNTESWVNGKTGAY